MSRTMILFSQLPTRSMPATSHSLPASSEVPPCYLIYAFTLSAYNLFMSQDNSAPEISVAMITMNEEAAVALVIEQIKKVAPEAEY